MCNILDFISIHAPREGGDGGILDLVGDYAISIHAPREGGDAYTVATPPMAGISIHAPREGGDTSEGSGKDDYTTFQSTPPARGATSIALSRLYNLLAFQSTPPARGATLALTLLLGYLA